jgi:putative ABC transport system permease protein
VRPLRPRLERARVRARTVAETEGGLTQSIQQLADFLGVVGLIALLLGGIGVASGVHAFVSRKIDTVAVLRCLGATRAQVLLIYVTQSAAMGLVGAAAGAALGVAIQFLLPRAARDLLPVDVAVQLEPGAIALGLLVGVWVALVFALRPLLALGRVSPLQALRRDDEGATLRVSWRHWPTMLVNLLLAASVVLLATSRARTPRDGLVIAAGIAGTLAVLWLSAALFGWLARRLVRTGWPYVVRQGVANLYRPANQTRAVVLSLGFGAFLVTTLYLVQTNLLRQFTLSADASRANLLFFDVQEDQASGLDSIVRASGAPVLTSTPIVTMRVAAINGTVVRLSPRDTALDGADASAPPPPAAAGTANRAGRTPAAGGRRGGGAPGGWALRREYRSTFRDSITPSERITAGRWFAARAPGDTIFQVSIERDVAGDMGVKLGDVVTWDVQGVQIPTRVTSLREVNWARFEPNFFAVFEPSALEAAPKQFVLLARAPSRDAVARLQRATVARYPNVSSVDLSLVLETVDAIVSKVSVAIRFLALFSLALGVPVLFSAVAATRRQRVREGVLLRTLGATRAQVRKILLSEYALLGLLGSITGMALAFGGAWALVRFVFESSFTPAWTPALAIAGLMTLLTIAIGLLSGRDVFRETPVAALRDA